MAKPEIYAKEILNDIRSGMDDVNLMHKYKVTVKGLESVFRKLFAAGLISRQELDARRRGYLETVNLSGLFRIQQEENFLKKKTEYSYSGMVEGVDILDYLQWILLDGRRTVLKISFPNRTSCKVYLKNGAILHATDGELEGEEALYSTMMCPRGTFVHLAWTEPDRKTIQKAGTQLLLEAARRRDEADR
jgi:hypothetical protein